MIPSLAGGERKKPGTIPSLAGGEKRKPGTILAGLAGEKETDQAPRRAGCLDRIVPGFLFSQAGPPGS